MASNPSLLLLDGSTGHELKLRGEDSFSTSMFANIERPEAVTAVHKSYVEAGCDVLTTNTFTLTPGALADVHRESELPALLHAACRCASDAAQAATNGRHVLIAGCLPPLNHCYLPELVPPKEDMMPVYEKIVKELAPRVDLFLAETLCSSAEACAVLQAASASGRNCWLSLTLHDDVAESGPPTLRGGESITELLEATQALRLTPAALLYNCCAPSVVSRALHWQPDPLPAAVERFGGYANGFQSTTSEWLFSSGAAAMGCSPTPHQFSSCACPRPDDFDASGLIKPDAYAAYAERWVHDGGANIIGGCCGVGPDHMRAVAQKLRSHSGSS